MHIGIHETPTAGPGDCHIKGGYIEGTTTFTVKLACVSFYKNLAKGLPPGAGVFVVVDAVTGAPLGVFQENRWGGHGVPRSRGGRGGRRSTYCSAEIRRCTTASPE